MSIRKERSKANKAAYALARKLNFAADLEQVQLPDTAPDLLPEEECNGYVKRRARGAKTDAQCVNEVCALVAQGLTLKTSLRIVGVPQVTWYKWRQDNIAQLLEKFEFANICNLDGMADDVIEILEDLKRKYDEAQKQYNAAMEEYNEKLAEWGSLPKDARGARPVEPHYKGPTDLGLKLAQARVDDRKWFLERRHALFSSKAEIKQTVSILKEIGIREASTPEEAMKAYARLIDARPD